MSGGIVSPENYEKKAQMLERHAGELEEKLAGYRRMEAQWDEQKTKLRRDLNLRLQEIDFMYMMLVQRKTGTIGGSGSSAPHAYS